MAHKPSVLIITGPCASGKTTIANLVAKKSNFKLISGDEIKNKLYYEIEQITDHPEKLAEIKNRIFTEAKAAFQKELSVVIDYIILGEEQIKQYQKEFGQNLIIKVLFPDLTAIIDRDQDRHCWTAGEDCARELVEKFICLKDLIGAYNFIDNSEETAEETYLNHFQKELE